jgi:hypothetical protein
MSCALDYDPGAPRATMKMGEMSSALAANGALIRELRDRLARDYGCEGESCDEKAREHTSEVHSMHEQLTSLRRMVREAANKGWTRAKLVRMVRAHLDENIVRMFLAYIARKELSMSSLLVGE